MKRMLLLAAFPLCASAAPFLVSDPVCYSADNSNGECPSKFEASKDGGEWQEIGNKISGNTISVYHDMASEGSGAKNWEIRAKNVWGSSDPVPFAFNATAPVAVPNIRVE